MAERYHNITQDEMEGVLLSMGFTQMDIPGTVELVYGKIVRIDNHRLSLRIMTGINPDGNSRVKGKDAIRIRLYAMYKGEPKPVGKPKKCLRVKNWANNITSAINAVQDEFESCPACGAPKVERQSKGKPFMGCLTFFETKCPGYIKEDQSPKKQTQPIEPEPKTKGVQPKQRVLFKGGANKYRLPDELISDEQREVTR